MKKYLLTLVLAIAWTNAAWACDLCGYHVSLNPNFNQNQIGLRFRYRDFVGHHTHSAGQTLGADRETYLTTELWGRWCPNPRWRVQALVPVARNTGYIHEEVSSRLLGLGDVSVLAYRQLVEQVDTNLSGWQHRVFAGFGAAAPTGLWKPTAEDSYEPLMQPGTGAWSGMAALSYALRKGNWGLGADYNYRISTRNALHYHFADRHNFSTNAFYQWKKGNFALLPFVGLYAEYANADQFQGERQRNTGGFAGFASGGLEVYLSRFSINFTAQAPLIQDLNGQQGQNKPRYNGGLFYSF